MSWQVLIAHAETEEGLAEQLAARIRAGGYQVVHTGTVMIGDSVVEEASRVLGLGGPVVLCGTIRAVGTGWAGQVVTAARRFSARVFVLQMEEAAYVEALAFGEMVAAYWRDPAAATSALLAALRSHYPPDSETDDEGAPASFGSGREADSLAERLRAGQTWADVLRSLLPGWEAELLKRCSAVRWFDAELVGFLGSGPPGGGSTGLEEIVEHGFAEPVPGATGRYRLRDNVRREQFARWWTTEPRGRPIPAELVGLSERLVRYHLDPAHPDPLEALHHDFLADAGRALERFQALYREADGRFDLACCRDLLNVFGDRLPLLPPELAEVRSVYRRYLDARSEWVDDWYRTARFTQPVLTRQPLDDLLAEQQPRVLQVWGAGGMGKTMLLRWLIARRCVPLPEVVACARVDFDSIDPFTATRQPWLVLLDIAAQLNRQLRDSPFHELLRQHGDHRQRLRLRPDDIHAYASTPYPAADDLIGADVRSRFADALRELPPAERVLIVVDTLEVALVLGDPRREQTELLALLRELAGVVERAPQVRLILSGRHNLADELPGYSEAVPAGRRLHLTGFTDEEARTYLSARRRLRPDLVESVIRAAAGVPFKLALIADAVDQRADMTPAEVEEHRDASLMWLIERVVERVESGVQWLLLYGVVPRVLDLAFVRDVMRPHLLASMSGGTGRHEPGADDLPARHGRRAVWRTDLLRPEDDLDVEDLWSRLKRYAGHSSWVTVERTDPETVRFQPEVVNPMRGLLMRRPPVFSDLQRDACAYFERRARDDPERRWRWIREAIYHRFQLEGPEADAYWRAQLAATRPTSGREVRRELALEVLGHDYAEEGRPLPWRDGRRPLIAPDTLLEARYQLALANAQLAHDARLPATHPIWIEAERALADVEHGQRNRRRPLIVASRIALARVPVSIARGRHEETDRLVATALRGRLAPEDRVWLLVCHADGLSAHRPAAAIARYGAALRLARRRLGGSGEARILHEVARCRAAMDDLQAALAACDEALEAAGEDAAGELRLLRGELRLGAGDASGAAGDAADLASRRPALAGRARLLQARALVAALRPLDALRVLDPVLAEVDTEPGGSARSREQLCLAAGAFELRGAALAKLIEAEPALRDLDAAVELWGQAGRVDLAGGCHLRAATFQLRELGDLREAAVRLDAAYHRFQLAAGEDWTARMLVQAELAARLGDPERARTQVDAVLQALGKRPGVAPRETVGAALAGLALGGHQRRDRYLALLCDSLDRIRPASARLAALDGLRRCPALEAVDGAALSRLRSLVPSPRAGGAAYAGLSSRDRAVLTLVDADLDRVVGQPVRAVAGLAAILPELDRGDTRAGLHEWLETASRVRGVAPGLEGAVGEMLITFDCGGVLSMLDAAVVVAGVLAADAPPELGATLLERAQRALEAGRRTTGRWSGLLYEAISRVARARGDAQTALSQALLAAQAYDQLEDRASRDRILQGLEPAGPAPESDENGRVLVTLREDGACLQVQVSGRGRVQHQGRYGPSSPIVSALLGVDRSPRPQLATAGLRELLVSSWSALGGELARLLGDLDGAFAGDGPPIDLGLRIQDAALHQVPWELAWSRGEEGGRGLLSLDPRVACLYRTRATEGPDREDVRTLQVGLRRTLGRYLATDGLLGPDTRLALAALQERIGVRPSGEPDAATVHRIHADLMGTRPAVTVVRTSLDVEERALRGSSTSGVPVDMLYRRRGFDVVLVDGARLQALPHLLAEQPTALVHFTAGLVEAGGAAALDLDSDQAPPGSALEQVAPYRLTATALDRLLQGLVPKPVVVLDVPGPRSPREIATQLLLRNAFAGDLFAMGDARGIVATGLARYAAQQRLYEAMIGALAGGAELGQVVNAIRSLVRDFPGPQDPQHAMAFGATTLFARNAAVRLPWAAR